jgi:hypothetical protein
LQGGRSVNLDSPAHKGRINNSERHRDAEYVETSNDGFLLYRLAGQSYSCISDPRVTYTNNNESVSDTSLNDVSGPGFGGESM